MNFKNVNRISGAFVFLFSLIVYVLTVQPTLSLWDCGEFLACAFTVSTPHPPGAPLHILVGRVFTMLPTASDIGLRMNYLSVLASAFSVLLVYLISTKIIKNWRGIPKSTFDIIVICGSSIMGALALGFCDSFWFNALEAEVYGFGTLLIAVCIYLIMLWWEKADEPNSDRYLLLVMFIVGISFGIHLLVLQVIPIAGLVYYFRRFKYNFKSFIIAVVVSSLAFIFVFWLIGQKYPVLLSENETLGILLFLALFGFIIYAIYKKVNRTITFALLSVFFIIVGYSLYISVLQRSSIPDLPLDENNPDNMQTLVKYLSREQYGDQPLIMPRRYSREPQHKRTWDNYSSDMDFMWKFQINEMFNRYLFWQFIGRAGYNQGDGVDFSKLFGIPFILGMLGVFYHFRRDKKLAFTFLGMFLIMGVITALYQNQQDPQPRERDYFYQGAFMAFAIWISLGVAAIIEQSKILLKEKNYLPATGIVLILSFIFVPVNMLRVNSKYQNRAGNFVPFDYAYNILQSVEKDAILVTNGDNDTFPLWCLQAVYRVRTDVRIVNLSLAQIDWYNLQLKNERPYGALTVPMTYTDQQLSNEIMMKTQSKGWDEKRKIVLEVPPTAYPDTMKNRPDKIEFIVPPTFRQSQGKQTYTFLKINDYIVLDILKANKWQRPFYFSVTVTEDNFVGLGDYLVMQGMAMRLVPYKTGDSNNPNNVVINKEIMRMCLFGTPTAPNKTPQYGFFFRGLNDKTIFYEEVQRRMIETYRSLFIRFAYSYSVDSTKSKEVIEILNMMEQKVPRDVVEMDYRLKYEVAMLYNSAGNFAKFNEYADEVEKAANEDIKNKKNISSQSYFNPYRLLLDIYDAKGNYQGALNLLDIMAKSNPNDASIIQKREAIKQKMSGNIKKDTILNLEEQKKYNEMP